MFDLVSNVATQPADSVMVFLFVSSSRQDSINSLVCIYCGYNVMTLSISGHLPFYAGTEGGSFTSKTETGPTLM